MSRAITINCACGRKHKLTRDGDKLAHETIEPEKPVTPEAKPAEPEKKKERSILEELFPDD